MSTLASRLVLVAAAVSIFTSGLLAVMVVGRAETNLAELQAVEQRLASIESSLGRPTATPPTVDLRPIVDRLAAIEATLAAPTAPPAVDLSSVFLRFDELRLYIQDVDAEVSALRSSTPGGSDATLGSLSEELESASVVLGAIDRNTSRLLSPTFEAVTHGSLADDIFSLSQDIRALSSNVRSLCSEMSVPCGG